MRRAIFPGTFDPFTIGHSSVVSRALTFIDEIVIGIGINENKNTYFPLEKREWNNEGKQRYPARRV